MDKINPVLNEKYYEVINLLKKNCEKNEFNEIKDLLEKYIKLIESSSVNLMDEFFKDLKERLFEYEKKILPEIESHKNLRDKLNPEILLLTIGMQKEPIILSILILKPKVVYFLCSSFSTKTVNEVLNDKDIEKLNFKKHIKELSEEDLCYNYNIINEIINSNKNKNILSDPTGGRKMMNTSLSLMSLYYRVPMVYLYGFEYKRQVFPFSEKLIEINNPFDYYGDFELKYLEELFNSHFYDAAIKFCENLSKNIRDLAFLKKLEFLKDLISIYNSWDKFEHSNPNENIKLSEKLSHLIEEFKKFNIKSYLPENIENNKKFLKEIEERWVQGKFNMVDEYRIIDLFLNAQRRGTKKQGKYDDAIARLYRIIEMLNSYYLFNFGLKSTEEPEYKELENTLKIKLDDFLNKYNEICRSNLPDKMLGLDNQKNILKVINHFINDKNINLLIEIQESKKFRELIKKRNRSILAHGTISLDENDWVEFKEKIEALLINIFGKEIYNKLIEMGKHGKIKLI